MKPTTSLVAALAGAALSATATAQFHDTCNLSPLVGEGLYSFDLAAATNDTRGDCGLTTAAPDQWIRYVATGDGLATISTCGLTEGDTVLSVYLYDCGTTLLACVDDTCGVQSQVAFGVMNGYSYGVRIAGYAGTRPAGQVLITRPNDACRDATSVTDGLYAFDTTPAATDGDASCGYNTGHDLWYRFAAPGPGTLIVSTCGLTSLDTVLTAFDSCGGAELACSDDAECDGLSLQSTIAVPLARDRTAWIRLAGYNDASGAGQVRFTFDSDDSCAHATPVADGVYPFDTTNAMNDGGYGCYGANDVWFSHTAAVQGWLDVTTCGLTAVDTVLGVFADCGTPLACNDDACLSVQSAVSVPALAGEARLVRVAGYNGARGAGQVRFASRSNDGCADAYPVTGGLYPYDTTAATTDGPASCGSMGSNVWFRFDAPGLGRLAVTTCGLTGQDTVLTALDGCGGPVVACNDDAYCAGNSYASRVDFPVQLWSQTYISLGGYLGARGSGQVLFEFTPCRIDFNGDGFVDLFDYDDYVNCFETGSCPPGRTADFNGDDFVDFFDYDDFVANFEAGC